MNGSNGSMKRLLTGLLAAALVTASFPSTVFAAGSSADPVPAVPEAVVSDPAAPVEEPADGEDPVIVAEPEYPVEPGTPVDPADPDDVSEPDETESLGEVTEDTDIEALSVDGAEEELSVIPGDAPARDGGVGSPATVIYMAAPWSDTYTPWLLSGDPDYVGNIASYDKATGVLVLNEEPNGESDMYEFAEGKWAALYANGDLILEVNDYTTNGFGIRGYAGHGTEQKESYGIYVNGNLTIRNTAGKKCGIYASTFDAGPLSDRSAGIYCTGKLTITQQETGSMKVEAWGYDVSGNNGNSYGIYAGNGVEIKNAVVEAVGGDSKNGSVGIYVEGSNGINISGNSDVTATGGESEAGSSTGIEMNDTANTTFKIQSGKVTATGGSGGSGSYGFYHKNRTTNQRSELIVSGGEFHANAQGSNQSNGIYTEYMTVNGGTVTADVSAVTATGSWANGITIQEEFVLTDGTVTAKGPQVVNTSAAGLKVSEGKATISGGTLKAYGGSIKANSSSVFSSGIALPQSDLIMTGGTVICRGGDFAGDATNGESCGFFGKHAWTSRNGTYESVNSYRFEGGTVTAVGGTLPVSSSCKSYGIDDDQSSWNTSQAYLVPGGTLLTFQGESAAIGAGALDVRTARAAVSKAFDGTNAAVLDTTIYEAADLREYKYVLAGTVEQMEEMGYGEANDIGMIGRIVLTGGVKPDATKNEFTYNQATNPLTTKVMVGTTDITSQVTITADYTVNGKPAYKDVGTYTVTATVKDGNGQYTGTLTQNYEVKPLVLTSAALTLIGADSYTYNPENPQRQYPEISGTITGKDAGNKTWTIPAEEFNLTYGPVNRTNASSTIAGTVTATAAIKKNANEKANYSLTPAQPTAVFNLYKASALALKTSSVDSYIGGKDATISLIALLEAGYNNGGSLSCAITQNPGGCTVSDGVFKCGTTPGTCLVTISIPGNENYLAETVTLTINVKNKDTETIRVSYESFKKTAANTYIGLTSGTTYTNSLPDPTYTVPENASSLSATYTGAHANGTNYPTPGSKPGKPGSYTFTVTCSTSTANYTGTCNFDIKGDLSSALCTFSPGTQAVYNGTEQAAVINSLRFDGWDLTAGTHYTTLSGGTATDVGNNTLRIVGKDPYYTGSLPDQIWTLRKRTPDAADFATVPSTTKAYNGSQQGVETPALKAPMTGCGEVTVYYTGTNGTDYTRSAERPIDAGVYAVTFDVAGGRNFDSASGLSYGTLTITPIDTAVEKTSEFTVVSPAGTEYTLNLESYIPNGCKIDSAEITDGEDGVDGAVSIKSDKVLALTFKESAETVVLKVAVDGGRNFNDYELTVTLNHSTCLHEHKTETREKAATCEQAGNIRYFTCSDCGLMFEDEDCTKQILSPVIPALGHDWEEWKITRQPTETAKGQQTRKCLRHGCNKKETEDIPMVLAPKSVVITSTDLTDIVYVGETLGLSAQVIANRPEEDIDQTVTWISSNDKIATVTDAGTVIGVKAGSATITATATRQITLKDAQGKDKLKTITVKSTFKVTVRAKKLTNDKLKLTIPVANRTQEDGVDEGRVQAGRTVKLTPVFEAGVDRADQALYWYSSDSTIAAVSQAGLVTAKAPGTVTITAASQTQEHVSRSCDILVYNPVTTLKFDKTAISLGKEETYYGLTLTALPGTATDRRIQLTWPDNSGSAADKRISVYGDDVDENGIVDLTNDEDGMVTLNVKAGDIAGRFTVTATALDGSNKKATCNLTVGNKVENLSIVEPKNQGTTLAAGKTIRLTPKFNNGIATNQPAVKTVEWKITAKDTSGNDVPEELVSTIATIDKNGNLKAVGAGTIDVSVKHIESNTVGDSSVSYRIYTPATRVAMTVKTITLKQGQSYTIGAAPADTFGATVTPGNATQWDAENSSFAYSRDNLVWQVTRSDKDASGTNDLVKIEGNKVVIGTLAGNKTRGTATLKVTAKSEGVPDKSDTCTITVLPSVPVTQVKLDKTAIKAGVDSIYELTATVTPAKADQSAVKWSVSNTDVLEIAAFTPGVDQPENFEENKFGTTAETGAGQALAIHVKSASKTPVKINAEAVSDSRKKATCTVTVGNAVNGVTIAQTDAQKRLIVGRSQTLKATVSCDTTQVKTAKPANATVKWSFTKVKDAEGHVLDPSLYDTVATLNPATGAVKATGCGTLELTATSTETPYGGAPQSAKVDIVTYVPVNKLAISQTRVTIGKGKTGYLWLTEVGPANALDPADLTQKIEWTSSDPSTIKIAAYSGAEPEDSDYAVNAMTINTNKHVLAIQAVGYSTKAVTIKGTTTDGSKKTVQCTVTVLGNVDGSEVKLKVEKSKVAKALLTKIIVKGRNADGDEWSAPEDGYDNSYKQLQVTDLPVKGTLKLTSHVNAGASDKTLVYRSSNPYIATVTAQGQIMAKNPGQVTITLTSADGGNTATCEVTVAP